MVLRIDEKPRRITRKAGYLEKRGKMRLVGRWKRWWCVLDGKLLLYYRSQLDYLKLSPCCGSLNIGLICDIQQSINRQLRITTPSQIIIFRAKNKMKQEEWYRVMIESISEINNVHRYSFNASQQETSEDENRKRKMLTKSSSESNIRLKMGNKDITTTTTETRKKKSFSYELINGLCVESGTNYDMLHATHHHHLINTNYKQLLITNYHQSINNNKTDQTTIIKSNTKLNTFTKRSVSFFRRIFHSKNSINSDYANHNEPTTTSHVDRNHKHLQSKYDVEIFTPITSQGSIRPQEDREVQLEEDDSSSNLSTPILPKKRENLLSKNSVENCAERNDDNCHLNYLLFKLESMNRISPEREKPEFHYYQKEMNEDESDESDYDIPRPHGSLLAKMKINKRFTFAINEPNEDFPVDSLDNFVNSKNSNSFITPDSLEIPQTNTIICNQTNLDNLEFDKDGIFLDSLNPDFYQ